MRQDRRLRDPDERRCRLLLRSFLKDQIVFADLDQVAVVDQPLADDLLAVDADPGEAVQVLDVVVAGFPQQPPVVAGDVLLREPDDVRIVTADGDLVTDDRDDGLPSLVVFDDQLHQRLHGVRCGNLPQPRGPPKHHLPMNVWTWSQSLLQ